MKAILRICSAFFVIAIFASCNQRNGNGQKPQPVPQKPTPNKPAPGEDLPPGCKKECVKQSPACLEINKSAFDKYPDNNELKRKSSPESEEKDGFSRYQISGMKHCSSCEFNKKCFEEPPKPGARKRLIRNLYWELQAETKLREKTRTFQITRGERQWKMEGIFAEAKDNHGLDRARYRGRAKVQIQAYMIAVVQNIKRMMGNGPVIEVGLNLATENRETISPVDLLTKLKYFSRNFPRPIFA